MQWFFVTVVCAIMVGASIHLIGTVDQEFLVVVFYFTTFASAAYALFSLIGGLYHLFTGPYVLLLQSLPECDRKACLARAREERDKYIQTDRDYCNTLRRPSKILASASREARRRYKLTEQAWNRIVGTETSAEEDKAATTAT